MRLAVLALTAALLMLPLRSGQGAPGESAPPLHFAIDLPPYGNEFLRTDDIAAHLVLRSGREPRLIAAFPAGDSGVGIWFEATAQPAHWHVLTAPQPLRTRDARGRMLRGFSVELGIDCARLRVREALLSSVRVLRTYESEGHAPASVHALAEVGGRRIRWSRDRLDGAAGYALALEALDDARIDTDGAISTTARALHLKLSALSGEPALHPLGGAELLRPDVSDRVESSQGAQVLSFLSYREKFLAGSWRFDTYFGRDTLMSLLLLRSVLEPAAIESGLRSVLQRLSDGGEVAHEETIGEFAILSRLAAGEPARAVPIYDYGMIDESFMLAPLAAQYLLVGGTARARANAFLASPDGAGQSCGAALVRNFLQVVAATAAFAHHPGAEHLIGLKPGHRSGDWRDSPDGLDGGRYPYDVNVALVPAALRAIANLLDSGVLDPYLKAAGARDALRPARSQSLAWGRLAAPLFGVRLAAASARARVATYAQALGIDAAPALAALPSSELQFEAIALDAAGHPLPVMHTDVGFTLLLDLPAPEALERLVAALLRPFPAGLMTPIGLLVANAAYAGRQTQAHFSSRAYHGAVVWSWQEALMIAGLDRQLQRRDLTAALRRQLERARAALWDAVEAVGALRSSELWSWSYHDGHYQVQPFEAAGLRDESDGAQLWSTVFLALRQLSASRRR